MLQEFKNKELWKIRTLLCDIMEEEKSDKSTGHNYTTVYHYLFKNLREANINFVEIGLGSINPNIPSNMGINGTPKASLRGWRRYFRKSIIHGCDIDRDILQDEDRIKTYFIDQLDLDSIIEFKNKFQEGFKFDIIIDDGFHTHEANINLFKYMNDILRVGGLYIIEDLNSEVNKIVLSFLKQYREYFEITLDKQTKKLQTARSLNWWEAYSPARDTVPDHVLYSDMNPTMVKVLNFDTLESLNLQII